MLRISSFGHLVCGGSVYALLLSTAWAQVPPPVYSGLSQDGTPIPDVNKYLPLPPLGQDSSCWLASAANILAAAGYGTGGAAQGRAFGIYNQLVAAYGIAYAGAPDQAISYWLAWYGKNPNSLEYRPLLSYTDVTAKYGILSQTDYTFLKGELYRGQYVGVQYAIQPHAMTFVGWNDNLGQSTWTDSDFTVGMNGYDSYANSFTPNWNLNQVGSGVPYLSNANGYVTLCPGLNKDPVMVANYDVAWTPSPMGPQMRVAGISAGTFDPVPGWQQTPWTDPQNPTVSLDRFLIDNTLDLDKQKHLELLVDFYGRNGAYINEDVRLRYLDRFGIEVVALPTSKQLSADNGQVLFSWELPIQPAWEEVLFPSYVQYGLLEGYVASWDVAVICVPEPTSLAILAFAGLSLLYRSRQRR